MLTIKGLIKGHLKLSGVVILKNNLSMWARLGIVANRMWTPSALLNAATVITGVQYSPHKLESYHAAIKDLEMWIDKHGGTYS